jgi:ribose 5-phosphate isomerase A
MTADQDLAKRMAAAHAVAEVRDGMVVGIGSGSTAECAIEALAERVAKGLRVVAIPTSEQTASFARRYGLELTSFAEHPRIDLTIDGADQVETGTLNLIKGRGGALFREKLVASASAAMIVVVDETKLAERLGGNVPLPIEVTRFGWQVVASRLSALGLVPQLRAKAGAPFTTDGGNYIVDCVLPERWDPAALDLNLARIVGVIETGLFLGLASKVVVGRADGAETLTSSVRRLPAERD